MKKFLPGMLLLVILAAMPALPQTSHYLAVAWGASTTSGVHYNVYRATTSTGTYTKINTADVLTTAYSDYSGVAGTTYFYEITALCNTTTTCPTGISGESAPSPPSAGAVFLGSPQTPPAAPTVTAH